MIIYDIVISLFWIKIGENKLWEVLKSYFLNRDEINVAYPVLSEHEIGRKKK